MKSKIHQAAGAIALIAALSSGQARAAQIVKTDELTLNLGGRFKLMGELNYNEKDYVRQMTHIYLFNTQDRLLINGEFDKTKFFFETAFGGEAVNTSNNQINMLEYYAEVPVLEGLSFNAGQFKMPNNRDSANDSGSLYFTEKSMLTQMFFNTGYDTGLGLHYKQGNADALVGTVAGAPDMPQRYLPEIMNFPPLVYARIGYDGMNQDPFHPKQVPTGDIDGSQFAIHANGMFLNDSNAGHSTDATLGSGYFDAPSANSHYGNILLSSKWNPLLGKTAANNGRVTAQYWQSGLDLQYRTKVGDSILSLGGQYTFSQFIAGNFAPFTQNGQTIRNGIVSLQGAQAEAALTNGNWDLAARYVWVQPDATLAAPASNQTAKKEFNSILGSTPIYELTFPSVGWRLSKAMKITAEACFQFNVPIDNADDGVYLLTEMPSQVTNTTRQGTPSGPRYAFGRIDTVPIGRMEFQLAF